VLAVPRSMPMSRENRPSRAENGLGAIGRPYLPRPSRSKPRPRSLRLTQPGSPMPMTT
jgi:hypothetical protein